MKENVVHLQGKTSDLIIQTSPAVEILYWGDKISGVDAAAIQAVKRAVPNGRLDVDTPVTISPEQGRGVFSSPGMEGHRQGLDWSPVFNFKSIRQDNNNLLLTTEDPIAGLRLVCELNLDPKTDVLQVRHTLTNLKHENYQVDRFAVTLPLPERADELMAFHGRWVREFQTHRVKVKHRG